MRRECEAEVSAGDVSAKLSLCCVTTSCNRVRGDKAGLQDELAIAKKDARQIYRIAVQTRRRPGWGSWEADWAACHSGGGLRGVSATDSSGKGKSQNHTTRNRGSRRKTGARGKSPDQRTSLIIRGIAVDVQRFSRIGCWSCSRASRAG